MTDGIVEVDLLCSQLEQLIDRRARLLTSTVEHTHRQVAAGALIRARNLLQGMAVLLDVQPDVCGLLMRNLIEAFVVGVILLYDPDGTDDLVGDYSRHVQIIIDRNELSDDRLPTEWPEPRRFQIEQAMTKAGVLLSEHGEEGDTVGLYDLHYRSESTWGGHGLGLAMPYVKAENGTDLLEVKPRPGTGLFAKGKRDLGIAAIYVVLLARHVFQVFGIGLQKLEEIGDALVTAVTRDPDGP